MKKSTGYTLNLSPFPEVLNLAHELSVNRVNVQDALTRFGKLWLTSSYYAPGLYTWDRENVKRIVEGSSLRKSIETVRNTLYMVGHDEPSAILYITDDGISLRRYRLLKTYDLFNRFPIARFRIVGSFRTLGYIHGIIYELPFRALYYAWNSTHSTRTVHPETYSYSSYSPMVNI